MAWIESHTEIGDHPKVYVLYTALSVRKAEAIGLLHLLWHFTMKFAWRDGDLTRFDDVAIARASGWEDDASMFINGLQKSGFLDGKKVHDWINFAGRLIKDRVRYWKSNKIRKQSVRKPSVLRPESVANLTLPNLTLPKEDTHTSFQKSNPQPLTTKPQEILNLWNLKADPSFPKVQFLNTAREKTLKARLTNIPTLDQWQQIFEKVNKSDFLTGRANGWRCNFDWVINPTNLTKILEGNYDNREKSSAHSHPAVFPTSHH